MLSLSLITWKKYQFSHWTPNHCNGNIHKNTYCKYGICSCREDYSQGFGDTAKWYLCLDHSLEADGTISFYLLHFSRLSLGTGCYSLHGGIRQQWGEMDDRYWRPCLGVCGVELILMQWGLSSWNPTQSCTVSKTPDSAIRTLKPHCLCLIHPFAVWFWLII